MGGEPHASGGTLRSWAAEGRGPAAARSSVGGHGSDRKWREAVSASGLGSSGLRSFSFARSAFAFRSLSRLVPNGRACFVRACVLNSGRETTFALQAPRCVTASQALPAAVP